MKNDFTIYLAAEAAGGVARHVIDLYSGLKKKSWPVALIVSPVRMEEMYKTELQDIPGSDLFIVPMCRGPHWSDVVAVARLRRLLLKQGKRHRHILHSHSTKAGILGAALRPWVSRSLYTPHAYRSVDPTLPEIKRKLIQKIERTFSSAYDRVIAVAPAEYDHALKLGIQPERVRHIPNGIRLDRYTNNGHASKACVQCPLTLGFVGRLAPQKNPLLFIDVLRNVAAVEPNTRAIIVGDGVLRSEMEAAAERYGLNGRIDWKGSVSAASVFPQMDVLIHTSFYEAMPYTLIESAACGVPMVATRNDGSNAILGEFLPDAIFDSFEARTLAEGALFLHRNAAVRAHHLSKLKEIAERFSLDRMVNDLAREYEHLLKD